MKKLGCDRFRADFQRPTNYVHLEKIEKDAESDLHYDFFTASESFQFYCQYKGVFMSNRQGGDMANKILLTIEKHGIFDTHKPEEIQPMIKEIVNVSTDYDCNAYEVLEDIGKRLNICYSCLNLVDNFAPGPDGICVDCNN